jgi:hypothetical protein
MCLKGAMKTQKEFVTHVAKHMESIALAALLREADSDTGSESDGGSNSTLSQLRRKRSVLPFQGNESVIEYINKQYENFTPPDLSSDGQDQGGEGGDNLQPNSVVSRRKEEVDFEISTGIYGTDWKALAEKAGNNLGKVVVCSPDTFGCSR